MTDHSDPSTPPVQNERVLQANDIANVIMTSRSMIAHGRKDDARRLLRRVIEHAPQFEQPWLQLLTLNPSAAEEATLLRTFLQYHPNHRFAASFRTRLQNVEIVAMLQPLAEPATLPMEPGTSTEAPSVKSEEPPQRLGDYLIARGWLTPEQITKALEEQKRQGRSGVTERLGTILLRNGHLDQEKLAAALAHGTTVGLGEFGAYLVRHKLLTKEQVGIALARQAALMVEQERWYMKAFSLFASKSSNRPRVPRLGELMVEMGMLTPEQLEEALHDREIEFNIHFD